MDESKDGPLNDSAAVALTGKIMVVAMILLFMVVVVVFFLHLYAKWFWWRRGTNPGRHRHLVLAGGQEVAGTGLDPSVLPVVILKAEERLECAVCLSEVGGEERVRLLPKCKHGFHVECIDMWFQSHSTCPICRNPLGSTSSNDFPTNVLFWGNESSSSSSQNPLPSTSPTTVDGMLVIDIPNPSAEEEDLKSPMPTRLKRLLSKGKRVLSPSTSSSTCVEPQHTS